MPRVLLSDFEGKARTFDEPEEVERIVQRER
jgi:hypothetical protein